MLKGIDLTIYKDDFIAIMGPSGSGKTTLLNILSTIDKPTQGSVILDGKDVTRVSNKELSKLRKDKIGFVFQNYNLLDTMILQDNIALPLALGGSPANQIIQKTAELAEMFELATAYVIPFIVMTISAYFSVHALEKMMYANLFPIYVVSVLVVLAVFVLCYCFSVLVYQKNV